MNLQPGVTVVIPTLTARVKLLARAVSSVSKQTLGVAAVAVTYDIDGSGAAVTRQRGLDMVRTQWTAFLDDDDEFLPHHLATLMGMGDVVHAQPVIVRDDKEMPQLVALSPGQITTTVVIRTELAREVGGFTGLPALLRPGPGAGEDGVFADRCRRAGAKVVNLPEVTWRWHHHKVPGNTQGNPANVRPVPLH